VQYRNTEIKIDQFVNYCNQGTINLSPAFQRGHVWNAIGRKNLLKNILSKKPIPAIFLYKEASGSKYSYNILDGKQRLESIILYIGNSRTDLRVERWKEFFFNSEARKHVDFAVEFNNAKRRFSELDDADVREFREYSIPTIEISLDESANLDEIISLFVDINQQGVAVSRFTIVKAMCASSTVLQTTFALIAQRQGRGKDVFYKLLRNEITSCFKNLRDVKRIKENNHKVDRIWERLIDVVLFLKTKTHRKPNEVLKGFLNQRISSDTPVTEKEKRILNDACRVLNEVYTIYSNKENPLFLDYTHLYTAITTIASSQLDREVLAKKLLRWCEMFEKKRGLPSWKKSIQESLKKYREASLRQTADPTQREIRQHELGSILEKL